MPCVGHAFLLLLFCIRGPPKLPPSHAPFFGSPASVCSRESAWPWAPPHQAARPARMLTLRDWRTSFLQCSLRMEAQECLGLELSLEDPRAGLMWPHFVDWLGQGLGKREKWMPFHTILGTHELFAVGKIHQNTD